MFDEDNYSNREKKPSFFTIGKFSILIGMIVMLFVAILCTHSISPGHVGVVNNKLSGGVQDKTLGQGWSWVAPWSTVTEYPVSTEVAYYTSGEHEGRKTNDSIVIGTKDGKAMTVDAQITYHMQQDKTPHIYNKFKGAGIDEIEYGYLRQNTQRITNDLSSQYTMMDIVGDKKAEFNTKLHQALIEFLEPDGIIVEQAGLGKVEPDAQTAQAIQAVANAQYLEKQMMYEKNAAVAQAEKQKAIAQGNADSKRIEADGQAYANREIQKTLTPELIQLKAIEKWDGKYPQTMLGSSQAMINIGK